MHYVEPIRPLSVDKTTCTIHNTTRPSVYRYKMYVYHSRLSRAKWGDRDSAESRDGTAGMAWHGMHCLHLRTPTHAGRYGSHMKGG